MPTTTSAHLRELGTFLKTIRARISPEQIGIRAGARRRTPGLRREEVAALARISPTWYTWIEQGRDVACSATTLNRIARALQMNAMERTHAFELAGRAPLVAKPRITTVLDESLRSLVDALSPHPAYLINGRWDVLHFNHACARIFGEFDPQSSTRNNVLARLFLDLEWRQRFVGWDATAESAVAQFRSATARYFNHESLTAFVAGLVDASSDFRAMWTKRELARAPIKDKTFQHPRAGSLTFQYATFRPDAAPEDVRLVVYLPRPTSRAAVARLVNAGESSRGNRVKKRQR